MGTDGDETVSSVDPGELRLSEPGIVVRHVADPERDRIRAEAAARQAATLEHEIGGFVMEIKAA